MDLRQGYLIDHHGTDGIEEDLESAKERLAKDGVEEEGFESSRQISVYPIDAERFVMSEVIRLAKGKQESVKFWKSCTATDPKRSTVWEANWQIGEDCNQSIGQRGLEGEIVRYLMYGEEKVLVCCSSNDIRRKEEWQGEYWRVPQAYCAYQLEKNDCKYKVFGQRLWAAELCDLQYPH